MFFTLADTLYFRFMNGIYLFFSAITSLGKNGLKEFEQFVVVMILFKITLQLPRLIFRLLYVNACLP